MLAAWRVLRCNPFSHGGYDPVSAQTLFSPLADAATLARRHPCLTREFRLPAADRLLRGDPPVLPRHHRALAWGWSIVALTVVVRAALMPLTIKQFKSMQNMARFQPEIKKLQEKYKGDQERLNQEMMKFYRENKVNPFASCLPLVAQLPVFLSLFYMLRKDLRHRHLPGRQPARHRRTPCPAATAARRSFLFIPDLTDKATGGVLVALIVLYVGSQLLSTILMSTATTGRSGSSSSRCRSSSSSS